MRRQVDLGSDEQWCGRVDLVAVDRPVVVEVQSERYHSALVDVRADAERRRRLEAAGFIVAEVTEHEVWHRPTLVVERVRRAVWAVGTPSGREAGTIPGARAPGIVPSSAS